MPRFITALGMLALVIALFGAMEAHAQGTRRLLPDPISTGDVLNHVKPLSLDDATRQKIFAAHDRYLAEFARLRESRVAPFLERERAATLREVPFLRSDPRVLLELLDDHALLLSAIDGLDQRFFDEVILALDEPLRESLSPWRTQRSLQRIISIWFVDMWLQPITIRDFHAMADSAELTDEERRLLEPQIAAWERQALASAEKLLDASREVFHRWVAGCEARGLIGLEAEALSEHRDDYFDAWKEARTEARAIARDIAIEQVDLLSRLILHLSPEAAHRFCIAWSVVRYADTSRAREYVMREPGVARLTLALERQGLTNAQREAAQTALDQYRQGKVRAYIEFVRSEAETDGGRSYMSLSQEELDRTNAASSERHARLNEADTALQAQVQAAIEAALGVSEYKVIDGLFQAQRAARRAPPAEDPDNIFAGGDSRRQWGLLAMVPAQVRRAEINRAADVLELNEDQRLILDELYAEYLSAVRAIAAAELEALKAALAQSRYDDETKEWVYPGASEYAKDEAAREALINAMDEREEALWRDVEALLLTDVQRDRLPLVRLDRAARRNASLDEGTPGRFEECSEWRMSLVEAVRGMEPDDGDATGLAWLALLGRAEALILANRQCEDAAWEVWRAERLVRVTETTNRAEGAAAEAILEHPTYAALLHTASVHAEATLRVVKTNRDALRLLVEALAPDHPEAAVALERSYRREAYPTVAEPAMPVLAAIDGTLARPEIESDLAARLKTLRAEVEECLDGLLSRAMETLGDAPYQGRVYGIDDVIWQDYQRRREAMGKINFDRTELLTRVIAALGEALGAEAVEDLSVPTTIDW